MPALDVTLTLQLPCACDRSSDNVDIVVQLTQPPHLPAVARIGLRCLSCEAEVLVPLKTVPKRAVLLSGD